jgi:hypothetical protein
MDAQAQRLLAVIKNLGRPKSVKEQAIRELRAIENATGVTYMGEYNGGAPRRPSRNPSEMARWEEETMGDMA